MAELVKQGAEAKLYKSTFYDMPCMVKERFPKTYRHPLLDASLTAQRIKAEAKAFLRCRMNGILTPTLYFVDSETNSLYMEFIEDAVTVREFIQKTQAEMDADSAARHLQPLAQRIGELVGRLHGKDIIHGDLTTSNLLLRGSPEALDLVVIDFGLSHMEGLAEDKGVDLYVLERAFLSTHPNTEALFQHVLDAYAKENKREAQAVLSKLEEVRMRGRKRTMVG